MQPWKCAAQPSNEVEGVDFTDTHMHATQVEKLLWVGYLKFS